MKPRNQDNAAPMWAALSIPVIWCAVIFASCYVEGENLLVQISTFMTAAQTPFAVSFNHHTPRFILGALIAYAFGIACYYSCREKRRPGEEHGSAVWGSIRQLNAKYRDKKERENIILTNKVRLGLDGYKHKKNINILCIGGSGAGKSRSFAGPNLMQAHSSYIVTDPKGELLRATAPLLIKKGYEVKVFDLINTAQSDCYNPFAYLRSDTDVLKLITNIIRNTTPKSSMSNDPFWEKAEIALDSALILYLLYEAPEEEQNFETVMYMIENAAAREDDEDYQSPLDMLFDSLEERDPNHIALKQYKVFKQSAGKTAKSILVSAAVRLAAFNLPEIARITEKDDLHLGDMGDKKQALFCVIPDNDGSLNYLIGMLYTQAFQELYYRADRIHKGRLPVPVRIIADEFANVALPDDFQKVLSTMRSRNISISIIIQNMAQLKELFKESWESIVGCCDTLLYLGGNEQSTHEYISKMLGKETIDTRTRGITRGMHGSSNTNYQNTGRELLTLDEVRRLDKSYALLFISGELPVIDRKFDLMKHPYVKLTEYGGAAPYVHKEERRSVAASDDLTFTFTSLDTVEIIEMEEIKNEEKDQQNQQTPDAS